MANLTAAKPVVPRHVLLVEPYPELRELLYDLLVDAGCEVDLAMTGYEMEKAITSTSYDCVLLNIDQNRTVKFSLDLASIASAAGARIIMIPDHEIDIKAIAAKGWLQLTKPFKVDDVLAVLESAAGAAGEQAAITQRIEEAEQRTSAKKSPGK
jgi:DNA-binding response OmpR family regulator